MKKTIILFNTIIAFIFTSCSSSTDEGTENKRINDSVAKVEADALEKEATIAQRMIDSTEAVNKDTTKSK